jgi:hypothetical protein
VLHHSREAEILHNIWHVVNKLCAVGKPWAATRHERPIMRVDDSCIPDEHPTDRFDWNVLSARAILEARWDPGKMDVTGEPANDDRRGILYPWR